MKPHNHLAARLNQNWNGLIKTEEEYQKLKNGTIDWKPHIKDQIETVTIPASVFFRLLYLDRTTE